MKKILVVDDEAIIRRSRGKVLRRMGYQALYTGDGQEGYETAVSEGPDLIIADRNMPGMNGYQMALRLKRGRHTRSIPIIGCGNFEDGEREIFYHCFQKGSADLYPAIRKVLGLH